MLKSKYNFFSLSQFIFEKTVFIPDWAPAERQGAHPEPDPGAADSSQVVPIHQRQEVSAQPEG